MSMTLLICRAVVNPADERTREKLKIANSKQEHACYANLPLIFIELSRHQLHHTLF
jgi:hypothetical protein